MKEDDKWSDLEGGRTEKEVVSRCWYVEMAGGERVGGVRAKLVAPCEEKILFKCVFSIDKIIFNHCIAVMEF